jgi:hypothetical protein
MRALLNSGWRVPDLTKKKRRLAFSHPEITLNGLAGQ